MKILKISTDNELTEHEFKSDNGYLRSLIGADCELYERVSPNRLYSELGHAYRPGMLPGTAISMLVDEEGLCKHLAVNMIGSWLYETDKHGSPIVGDILFVGEMWGSEGVDFCGIEEATFMKLRSQLLELLKEANKGE